MKPAMRLSITIVIVWAVCVQFGYTDEELTALIKQVKPCVVTVIGYDSDDNPIQQGSGFFINDSGHFITNYHVIDGAKRVDVKTSDGNVYPVTHVIASNRRQDLIRLKVNTGEVDVHYLKFSNDLPEVGDDILVIGSPLSLELTASNGIVSAIRELGTDVIIQVTAPVSAGSSGSPVISMKGIVVGIATWISEAGQNLNFIIPSREIQSLEDNPQLFRDWVLNSETELNSTTDDLYNRGAVLYSQGKYSEAIDYFLETVTINKNQFEAWFQLGNSYRKLGQYDRAVEPYQQAIQIKPDLWETYYNLGIIYRNLDEYHRAIESYKQAIKINPDYANVHLNLGVAYDKLGEYQKAILSYKQAISLNQDFDMAYNNLAEVYNNLGRYREAIESRFRFWAL